MRTWLLQPSYSGQAVASGTHIIVDKHVMWPLLRSSCSDFTQRSGAGQKSHTPCRIQPYQGNKLQNTREEDRLDTMSYTAQQCLVDI